MADFEFGLVELHVAAGSQRVMRRLAGTAYALAVTFWLLTSFYALLASQNFAYEQFLKPQLLPPLARFAEWHAWLNLGVLASAIGARWAALASPGVTASRHVTSPHARKRKRR